jgi:hypothetical protein
MASVNHVAIVDNDTVTKHAVIGFIKLHKQICSLTVGSSCLVLDVTAPGVCRTWVVRLDVEPQETFTASQTLETVTRGFRVVLEIVQQN